MSATLTTFADPLGPRGRRRVAIATVAAGLVLAAGVYVAGRRLDSRGQFDGDLWRPLLTWEAFKFLLIGLRSTVHAALTAMVLAFAVGFILAMGRLTHSRIVRIVATTWIEFFRGIPLLLLILFCFFGLPRYGIELGRFWFLVLALVLYNSAVLAEIIRAGILSLDKGQSEAATAVGLRYGQSMRLVILPQALRRMIPALVSQMVTLLKDTSLGIIISFEELLRRSQIVGQLQANPLQAFVIAALMYIAVNFSLSMVARWLERRQARSKKIAAAAPITVAGIDPLAIDPLAAPIEPGEPRQPS
jgi:glutamate transport system permease protein